MFEACNTMAGSPWLCWAIQITAVMLIGLFLWRIVKRHQEEPPTPPWKLQSIPEPVRPHGRGPLGT